MKPGSFLFRGTTPKGEYLSLTSEKPIVVRKQMRSRVYPVKGLTLLYQTFTKLGSDYVLDGYYTFDELNKLVGDKNLTMDDVYEIP